MRSIIIECREAISNNEISIIDAVYVHNLPESKNCNEERDGAKRESVHDIVLTEISDFPDHPFKVKMDEEMVNMAESVRKYGF